MAKTTVRSVPNMADATIPADTQFVTRLNSKDAVLSARDERAEYDADNAAWLAAHPGQIPPGAVEIADPEEDRELVSVTLGEKVFVKWRFKSEDEGQPGRFQDENDRFVQVNATNFPGMNIPAFRAAALAMHDARRSAMGLEPSV